MKQSASSSWFTAAVLWSILGLTFIGHVKRSDRYSGRIGGFLSERSQRSSSSVVIITSLKNNPAGFSLMFHMM